MTPTRSAHDRANNVLQLIEELYEDAPLKPSLLSYTHLIEEQIAKAIAQEREACAQILDRMRDNELESAERILSGYVEACGEAAEAIRARNANACEQSERGEKVEDIQQTVDTD